MRCTGAVRFIGGNYMETEKHFAHTADYGAHARYLQECEVSKRVGFHILLIVFSSAFGMYRFY